LLPAGEPDSPTREKCGIISTREKELKGEGKWMRPLLGEEKGDASEPVVSTKKKREKKKKNSKNRPAGVRITTAGK